MHIAGIRKWVVNIFINKEAGFVVYSWIKETNLGKSSLLSGSSLQAIDILLY